ncbi:MULTISPECIES: TIGR03619 family F420-dependent LLM class oxidoreductase [Streptomyces]|uniref:TIGR03619 family F420-dependent LLM class oxidoreductase n=1 Tax=Streptomyces katrae TaxID=68223 RepID=A0ABT7H486_9ACTN|nr:MULTISPECIES: TIGR03619 family F420-dependent LLM class oxidoreductase [Streptomyces]MDK9500264.1 TIGR03619 family F420-dependent LLM class oxidoreductase [Streptomyces katrae]RST04540.1 TIGR03619 family F420-dependent LLM class oxidoreductase [Streptomyces sp. WAC07149]GLX21501.1 LLM class F420-dependent oxidoreductase [Streptomyces lavendulae subsp. lavendulae]GLX28918.1 LLM class F420-dependent oxidoreductase [Streptomyces lavendulae subsp. lavendulae]
MEIGIALPQYGTHAQAARIAGFARDAEHAGFDSLWVGDRSLTPVAPSDIYPGHTPENPYPPEYRTFLDPLTVLTVAATATHRARLGTSTLNAPWYPPLLLARTLTSLDQVSGGRLDAGFGIGWLRDEYTAVNADFGRRGERLDEILDVLQGIWTEEEFGHEGTHWRIPRAHVGLRPVQRPHPPVYLGGFSPAAMRRVGRRADGWVGAVLPAAALAGLWAVARQAAEDAGRDPDALRRNLRFNAKPGTSYEEIAAVLAGIRETGADSCFVDLQQCVREPDEALELGIKVLDLVRAG